MERGGRAPGRSQAAFRRFVTCIRSDFRGFAHENQLLTGRAAQSMRAARPLRLLASL